MNASAIPEGLSVIAGRGVYPRLFVASARKAGVKRIAAVAFKGETDRRLAADVDACVWMSVGQLDRLIGALKAFGHHDVVMVGQIAPSNLFRVRPDRRMRDLLHSLEAKNAHTIFGAVCAQIEDAGCVFRPAGAFMQDAMPEPGCLTDRAPTPEEDADLRYGLRMAKAVSGLDIGQTVVVKDGVVLAVEGFEGTDRAIRRGGKLGRGGVRVAKVAKQGHDARFDIPVVGEHTVQTLRKARATALGVEAGRTLLLDRHAILRGADRLGIAVVAFDPEDKPFDSNTLEQHEKGAP